MKCSLGISTFLEEISILSHSIVFLYFFALIAEEGFLISPCYSLELCIQMLYLSFSPFPFTSLLSILCMQFRKQQLEPDVEQQTGSKLGKEYVKAVYCHPAYLTSLQSCCCCLVTKSCPTLLWPHGL